MRGFGTAKGVEVIKSPENIADVVYKWSPQEENVVKLGKRIVSPADLVGYELTA